MTVSTRAIALPAKQEVAHRLPCSTPATKLGAGREKHRSGFQSIIRRSAVADDDEPCRRTAWRQLRLGAGCGRDELPCRPHGCSPPAAASSRQEFARGEDLSATPIPATIRAPVVEGLSSSCMAPMMIDRQAKASPQHWKQAKASSAHVGIGLVLSVMARPLFCRGATDHFRVFAPILQGGAGDATEPVTSAEVRIEANRRVIEDLILLWHSSRMMVSASKSLIPIVAPRRGGGVGNGSGEGVRGIRNYSGGVPGNGGSPRPGVGERPVLISCQ